MTDFLPADDFDPEGIDRDLADLALNDMGNAERLIGRFGEDILFADEVGWHVWDGRRFQREAGEDEAMKLCFATVKAMDGEVEALRNDPDLKRQMHDPKPDPFEDDLDQALAKRPKQQRSKAEIRSGRLQSFAVTAGNAGKIAGMLKLAKPLKRMPPQRLDAEKRIFTVRNGALKLDETPSHEPGDDPFPVDLVKFNRAHLGTKLGGVEYDPDAMCPKFQKFLESIVKKPAVRAFLQRWFGYCLTGDTSEQVFLVFYGKGANGKSQLLIAIRAVLGDYAATSDIKTFLADDNAGGGSPTPDIARLPGARLVVASEPEQGQSLDESTIKTLTGGEAMTARKLFRDIFEFDPAFKLILSSNYKIRIRGTDNGIWRRVLLVPFEETIAEADMVKDMGKMLGAEEGPGILNWMLDGYAAWRDYGLAVPQEIRDATDEYRAESDPIGIFMVECVELVKDDDRRVDAVTLRDIYGQWAREAGFTPMSDNAFGRAMTNRGVHRHKSSNAVYRGIILTNEAHDIHARFLDERRQKGLRYPGRDSEPAAKAEVES